MNQGINGVVQFNNPVSRFSSDTGNPSFIDTDTTDKDSHPNLRVVIQNNAYRITRPFEESQPAIEEAINQPAIEQDVDDAVNNAIYGEALNR